MEPIRVSYTLTLDEYIEPLRPMTGAKLRLSRFAVCLVGLMGLGLSSIAVRDRAAVPSGIFILLVIWCTWYFVRTFSHLTRSVKPIWERAEISHVPINAEIDETGIRWIGPDERTERAWRAFKDWNETDLAFHLFQDPTVPYIIPKRVLSREQTARVRDLLADNITRRSLRAFEVLPVEQPADSR